MPESCELAAQVREIADLGLVCREAGTAYVKTGFPWEAIVKATKVADSTLQGRWTRFYENGGLRECR